MAVETNHVSPRRLEPLTGLGGGPALPCMFFAVNRERHDRRDLGVLLDGLERHDGLGAPRERFGDDVVDTCIGRPAHLFRENPLHFA